MPNEEEYYDLETATKICQEKNIELLNELQNKIKSI